MACSTQTQFRRGTAAANSTFTGVEGEVTYATDTHRLYTHDGVTAGGFVLALFSDIATQARLALSVSAPLTYNNGTGAFAITLADGTHNGYLSSTDWNTFNNKQSATAPGVDKDVIFNNGGAFAGSGGVFTYDNATGNLSVGAEIHFGTNLIGAGGEFNYTGGVGLNINTGFLILNIDGSATFADGVTTIASDGTFSINSGNIVLNIDGSATFASNKITLATDGTISTVGAIQNDSHQFNDDGSGLIAENGLGTRWDTDGKFIKYTGDTTAGNGLASIVGYYNDTKTDTNIAATTLFTPPVDGMYEVSVVQLITSHGTSGTLTTTVAWTDEVGATTAVPAAALTVASNGRNSGMVVISATAGNAISFSTTLANVGSTTYRVKLAVKRLS